MDIETLLSVMKYYQTSDKIQLLKEAAKANNKQHTELLITLIKAQNWNIIYRKSQEEYEFISQMNTPTSYYNFYIESIDDSRQKTMSYQQTKEFVQACTLEQNIDLQKFILEIYMIFRTYHPKKNTLYLQGSSNAGKTYVLEGLVPHKDKVGSHITSKDFQFQECITKLINELTL